MTDAAAKAPTDKGQLPDSAEGLASKPRASVRWLSGDPRTLFGAALLLGGAAVLAVVGHAHYPIQHWLFWRYAGYWVACAFWAFACLSGGRWLLRIARLDGLPVFDGLAVGFAAGVVLFFLGMFAAGLVGALTPWFAVVWPVALTAADARRTGAQLVRCRAALRRRARLRTGELAALGFGLIGIVMVYFTILTPQNLGFDTQWYHLPIAEHFAAARRIGPFEEGWYLGAYPHLASVVYAWAFLLLPRTMVFDRVLLAAHLELVFFLVTLASIPLMVRRLVRSPAPRATWAAMFLFPAVLLYDGGLFGAADHVLALFAIPVYLCLLRAMARPSVARCALLAIVLSGALLTKYQAIYLLAPVVISLLAAVCLRRARGLSPRLELAGLGVALALGLLVTAPHWLANWWWYGDPMYPLLHGHMASHPFTSHAASELFVTDLLPPPRTMMQTIFDTGHALLTFSFEPHDWPTYHGSVPVFGSLFTIASLLVIVTRRSGRVLHALAMTMTGLAIWYLTFPYDRYLQSLLPWMVAITVAIAHQVWRQLPVLRPWLAAPVALQIIWGTDVYFIPANDACDEIDRPSPIKSAVDLIASGYRGDYVSRLHPFAPWEEIGAALPPGAKVLLHERYLHLGLGAMSVSDLPGWQGGISYDEASSPRAIFDLLSRMGVTHVVWETGMSHEHESEDADIAFFDFATRFTLQPRVFGRFTVARMPVDPPPEAVVPGSTWHDCAPVSSSDGTPKSPIASAAPVVATIRDCADPRLSASYDRFVARGARQLWVRKRP